VDALTFPPMAGVPLDAFPRTNDNESHGTKIGIPQSSLSLKKARKIGNYWPHGGYRKHTPDVPPVRRSRPSSMCREHITDPFRTPPTSHFQGT
jgi:hypothetical protein